MKIQEWNNDVVDGSEVALAVLGGGSGKTMWKCEQLRAGELYAKFMFNTRDQAESFAAQMAKLQPDIFIRIEPVEASAIWN